MFNWLRPRPTEAHAALIQELADTRTQLRHATSILEDLHQSIGTVKSVQVLSLKEMARLSHDGQTVNVRAPHDQDPRLWSARDRARRFLGKAI